MTVAKAYRLLKAILNTAADAELIHPFRPKDAGEVSWLRAGSSTAIPASVTGGSAGGVRWRGGGATIGGVIDVVTVFGINRVVSRETQRETSADQQAKEILATKPEPHTWDLHEHLVIARNLLGSRIPATPS